MIKRTITPFLYTLGFVTREHSDSLYELIHENEQLVVPVSEREVCNKINRDYIERDSGETD